MFFSLSSWTTFYFELTKKAVEKLIIDKVIYGAFDMIDGPNSILTLIYLKVYTKKKSESIES